MIAITIQVIDIRRPIIPVLARLIEILIKDRIRPVIAKTKMIGFKKGRKTVKIGAISSLANNKMIKGIPANTIPATPIFSPRSISKPP